MFAYPRIAERLFGRAHAIEPGALRAIMEGPMLRRILAGETKHDDEAVIKASAVRRARMAAAVSGETVIVGDGSEYALTRDGIAVVPVFGVLAQRFDFMAALCGWATYEGIIETCDALANDYRVKAVLFDIESPGGEVSGMLDAADAIIELGQLKLVWSIANAYAYSAAYALAGSAENLVVPRMADVGSIGAVIIHVDESAADAAQGFNYTAVYSGARKIDGWAGAPLNDASQAVMQERVDYARQQFASLVGRQGRVTEAQAIATEAAVYTDQAAIDAGLADEILNFDQTIEKLTELALGKSRDNSIGAFLHNISNQENANMANPKTAAMIAAEQAETERLAAEAKAKSDAEAATLAAKANEFTVEMAAEITDLCALAGVPSTRANEFIKAKTPVEKARAALLKEKSDRDAAAEINPTARETSQTAGWDEVTEKVNKEFGIKTK